jgi:hypothetical protein
MKIQLFDRKKLGGRTGGKAVLFVLGVLLVQWCAIGLLLATLWGIQQLVGTGNEAITCTLIILASMALSAGLFCRRGLELQHRRAEQFESFLSSLFTGRKLTTQPICKAAFSLINGDFGRSESPYPPPPKNNLA